MKSLKYVFALFCGLGLEAFVFLLRIGAPGSPLLKIKPPIMIAIAVLTVAYIVFLAVKDVSKNKKTK